MKYFVIVAIYLFALGCGGNDSGGSDNSIFIGGPDASTADVSEVPDEPSSSVGGACTYRQTSDFDVDYGGCDQLCMSQVWSCDQEEVDGESVTACDGYCSRTCDADSPCPSGYSCRLSSGRGARKLHCLRDAPLDGEFSERSPADGVQFAEGTDVQLKWTFGDNLDSGERASFFEVHWGPSPDELSAEVANGFSSKTGSFNFYASDLAGGQRVYWKVVATGNGGLQAETSVWSFEIDGESEVKTPCPDEPSVTIDGRRVGTVQILDRCWTKGSFRVGQPLGGDQGDTYYDDGQVEYGTHSGAYFYSWWEAHNAYPVDARLEPSPDLVDASICPDGWRLPTRNEWTQAVRVGNEMRPGQQSNALDYGWVGWFPPVVNGISECSHPSAQDDVFCGRFGERLGSTYMFLVGPNNSDTNIPLVSISRPSGGSSDFVVERSNVGSPWAGYQMRCVRD